MLVDLLVYPRYRLYRRIESATVSSRKEERDEHFC